MIRVTLPWHLRNLAQVGGEIVVNVSGQVTQRSVLDAIEEAYPMLRGTIRDQVTAKRRPFLRFFACDNCFFGIMRSTRRTSSSSTAPSRLCVFA